MSFNIYIAIYWLIATGALVLSLFAHTKYSLRILYTVYVVFTSFILSVRPLEIGIDTIVYSLLFESLNFSYYPLQIDPLFKALIYLVRFFTEDPRIFLFICYLAINSLLIKAFLLLEQKRWCLVYTLFSFSFLYYNVHFNILRQGLAFGFILVALAYAHQRKSLPFICFFIIGLFFHVSSVVVLACLLNLKIKKFSYILLIAAVLIPIFLLYNPIVAIAEMLAPYHWSFEKLYLYTKWDLAKAFTFRPQYILTIALLAFSIYIYKDQLDDPSNKIRFYVGNLLIGLIICSVFSFDQMVADRIFYIFFFFNFLILANLYFDKLSKNTIFFASTLIVMFAWLSKTLLIQVPNWFFYKAYMETYLQ
tara:strand:- start:7416 stop:8504 length:1089 start_codon:yes stop_codon:yes gene_type:complete